MPQMPGWDQRSSNVPYCEESGNDRIPRILLLSYALNRAVVSMAQSDIAHRKDLQHFDIRAEQTTPYTKVASKNRRSGLDTAKKQTPVSSWRPKYEWCGLSYAVMAPSRLSPYGEFRNPLIPCHNVL